MTENTENIGIRIKKVRKNNNLTIEQCAQNIGIKSRTYEAYERGQNEPNLKFLQDFIEYFKVDGTWLITGKEINPKIIDIDLTKVKGITIKF